MLWYVVIFVMAIIVFGVAYTLLTPIDHGIGQNLTPLSDITFLEGIYFSIVTFSSLGYGDMHPMGASKVLACVEVLMGLALIGVLIAKVTSQRLSYHVSRLFSSDAQKRLEEIAARFDTSRDELKKIMPKLARTYQSTPRSRPSGDRGSLISNFREVISDLQSRCVELRDYFSDETAQGNYFRIAPVNAVVRVGDAVDEAFWILGQLIASLSPQSSTEILDRRNRQRISEAMDSQKQVCNMVCQHAAHLDIQAVFQRIKETCEGVPESYFAVPAVPEELQPDQILRGTDEPQHSGADDKQADSS